MFVFVCVCVFVFVFVFVCVCVCWGLCVCVLGIVFRSLVLSLYPCVAPHPTQKTQMKTPADLNGKGCAQDCVALFQLCNGNVVQQLLIVSVPHHRLHHRLVLLHKKSREERKRECACVGVSVCV